MQYGVKLREMSKATNHTRGENKYEVMHKYLEDCLGLLSMPGCVT